MHVSKSYTTTKNPIDRQHTKQGQLVSTITSNNNYSPYRSTNGQDQFFPNNNQSKEKVVRINKVII